MRIYEHDTIAAISTPLGRGAIAVIRISGEDAIGIVDSLFCGKTKLSAAKGYTVHYGNFLDGADEVLDTVLVTVFRGPRSYTGEDIVEISSHGGHYVPKRILQLLCEGGARSAEGGEFTRRAFLNGKMDLSQAEAVAGMILSKSNMMHRTMVDQLRGGLSLQVRRIRDDLVQLCSLLELDLDFSEEDIELISREKIRDKALAAKRSIDALAETYTYGKIFRDGISVAIVGAPNVGKSSLFNALLRQERAIVSATPGTTRDYLEETIEIGGIPFKLRDTAGLRITDDTVEQQGVAYSDEIKDSSDLVLFVRDVLVSEAWEPNQSKLGQVSLNVLNKVDLLLDGGSSNSHTGAIGAPQDVIRISAKTGQGINALKEKMVMAVIPFVDTDGGGAQIVSERHFLLLSQSSRQLELTISALKSETPNEFIASEVRLAVSPLSSLIGDVVADDVLNSIFSSFCIGK